jgi:hypothetical protein
VTVASTAANAGREDEPARRRKTTRCRRSGWLAVLAAMAAVALAGCGGGASTPHVASLGNTSANGKSGGSTAAAALTGSPTKLVDEWAACERSHGDIHQADPVIDTHGVINIILPAPVPGQAPAAPGHGGGPVGDAHNATGTCSQYLAAAQIALRKADPVPEPGGITLAQVLQETKCIRANGVPNYPYPTGREDDGHPSTNFNGTGVDPNSPSVLRATNMCARKLGLPTWWINGWGPPGDITTEMAGVHASTGANG